MKIFVVSGIPDYYDEKIVIKAFTKKKDANKFKKKQDKLFFEVSCLRDEIMEFERAIRYRQDKNADYKKNDPIKLEYHNHGNISISSLLDAFCNKLEVKNSFACYKKVKGRNIIYSGTIVEEIELD